MTRCSRGTMDGDVDGATDVVDARYLSRLQLARVGAGSAVKSPAEGCVALELLAVEHPHEGGVGVGAGCPTESEAVGEG